MIELLGRFAYYERSADVCIDENQYGANVLTKSYRRWVDARAEDISHINRVHEIFPDLYIQIKSMS